MSERSAGTMMEWILRNRVAFTVLAGISIIGLFAVAQSGIAIFVGARFASGFSQMATKNLPELINAAHLSELSQSLVSTAPNIAGAGSQLQRQTTIDQLNSQLASLALAAERIEQPDSADRRVAEVRNR